MSGLNNLAKHYPSLTPDERFSLTVGAAARGDEVEVGRVIAAAKREVLSVPDTFGRATAWIHVGQRHRAQVLELSAYLFATVALAVQPPTDNPPGKLRDVARMYGYLIKTRVAGWKRFCQCRGLVHDFLNDSLPGGDAVEMALMEANGKCFPAFSLNEFRTHAAKHWQGNFTPITVESVAEELESIYDLVKGMFQCPK